MSYQVKIGLTLVKHWFKILVKHWLVLFSFIQGSVQKVSSPLLCSSYIFFQNLLVIQ